MRAKQKRGIMFPKSSTNLVWFTAFPVCHLTISVCDLAFYITTYSYSHEQLLAACWRSIRYERKCRILASVEMYMKKVPNRQPNPCSLMFIWYLSKCTKVDVSFPNPRQRQSLLLSVIHSRRSVKRSVACIIHYYFSSFQEKTFQHNQTS